MPAPSQSESEEVPFTQVQTHLGEPDIIAEEYGTDVPWKMAWPRYSRNKVDEAGKLLLQFDSVFGPIVSPTSYSETMEVVNDWRQSHTAPLYLIRKVLENRAKRINSSAIVAHRLKRLPSIEKKLRDNAYRPMTLTQIQDIGGCRAIMPTIVGALELAALYSRGKTKSQLYKLDNYIYDPKADGYRSVHLVHKFRSDSLDYRHYNNHRIEIQIRSQLQHAWATAVEMLLTFAGIPLRLAVGAVHSIYPREIEHVQKWRRFFQLMGSVMALREQQPIVPETPSDEGGLRSELRPLAEELNVINVFNGWRVVLGSEMFIPEGASQFLLKLNPRDNPMSLMSVDVTGFAADDDWQAFRKYIIAERPQRDAPSANVVLVSVDSVDELEDAYPNYYGDTGLFVDIVREAIQ